MKVVATAGHVDHGKSTLVHALTGTDPDRWEEEKRRGLTIDLGFAYTTLSSGDAVGFVDVPGHVRFLKNMLAGVGSVRAVMLVVAATEGWMPQTEEHLRILEVLGYDTGLSVVTMAGRVDASRLGDVEAEVAVRLEGTFLSEGPVVACDAVAGTGLEEVESALGLVLAGMPAPVDDGRPRLWVDRAFSVKGAGTVVTGTLTGGSLSVHDTVLVVPGRATARVRGIQVGHETVDRARPGSRVALNLAGPGRGDVERGAAVVLDGQWVSARAVDVELDLLPGEAVAPRTRVHAYVGSGEHAGRLRVLEGALARLELPVGLPLAPGDRVVLRDPGPSITLGGGRVVDVAPAAKRGDAVARASLTPLGRALASSPAAAPADLARLTGRPERELDEEIARLVEDGQASRLAGKVVSRAEGERVLAVSGSVVDAHVRERALEPGPTLGTVADAAGHDVGVVEGLLGASGVFSVSGGIVTRVADRPATAEPEVVDALEALEAFGFDAPSPEALGVAPGVLRALTREGHAVDLGGIVMATSVIGEAERRIAVALGARGELTVAEVRDLLGSSRRTVVPLLRHLDDRGVTRRRGDVRVLGPRAQPPASGPG